MTRKPASREEVKHANRLVYDTEAGNYEALDGRRSPELMAWLRGILVTLRNRSGGGHLLDIGTGAGFVCRAAEGIFQNRVGMDISPGILVQSKGSFESGCAADTDFFPYKDASFNLVSCFAVLHHLYDFETMAGEIFRVLKPGGIFYSDHDMSKPFYSRFSLPLRAYRFLGEMKNRAAGRHKTVPADLLNLSEFHSTGIDSIGLKTLLKKTGFNVTLNYHWYGLNPLVNLLFGQKLFRAGRAPLVQIFAQKPPRS